jgi:hypothetical protein
MIVKIHIPDYEIGILSAIGRTGKASSNYPQTTEFCIQKAIDEFIVKYTGKEAQDFFDIIEKEIKEQ